jgi:HAD superfamily hydrolase (TIGR01490 family)
VQAGVWLARYQLGFASLESAIARAISTLSGVEEHAVRQRTVEFYRNELRPLYRPGARSAVDTHRLAGDQLVLLTSSSIYLAELAAEELRLDDIICNRFEVDDQGRHTGRTLGEVCFGDGKLRHAVRYAQEAGVPLGACTFYTDSYSDLPVLEAVGYPVAVNPDRRLRHAASRRGWKVVDWGTP